MPDRVEKLPKDKTWVLYVCPTCDAARLIPRPAPHNWWCDGGCSHPKVDMERVVVSDARVREDERRRCAEELRTQARYRDGRIVTQTTESAELNRAADLLLSKLGSDAR